MVNIYKDKQNTSHYWISNDIAKHYQMV